MSVGLLSFGSSALGGMSLVSKVLLVYNTNSSDSIAVKNYYLAHRPGMASVDVLAVTCATTEQIAFSNLNSDIKTPIINWLSANPGIPKYYIVLCRGIPTRTTGAPIGTPSVSWLVSTNRTDASWSGGIGYDSAEYNAGTQYYNNSGFGGIINIPYTPGGYADTRALVCTMDMGSLAATTAYIDKLSAMCTSMASPNVVISATNAGLGGSHYYLDEAVETFGSFPILSDDNRLLANGISSGRITFVPQSSGTHISTGTDVTGYETWGTNGGMTTSALPSGGYPNDGSIVFSGKSNWFLVKTIESYNGMQGGGPNSQGCFEKFFYSTAFGGTSYSNTPVGFAGHTDEPTISGVEAESYLINWDLGLLACECAWGSRCTPYFAFWGDPLVKR